MRWVACVAVVVIVSCGGHDSDNVSSITESVVYGVDDRQEVFEHPDGNLRALATDSVLALIPRARLVDGGDGTFTTSAPTLGQRENLCAGERFSDQPTAAFCSGVLIDSDLVLTAGHCVESQTTCDALNYVFDYHLASAGELATIDTEDVFGCSRIVVRQKGGAFEVTPDFAVIQLDRPVSAGRMPAPVRPVTEALQFGDPLAMIGYGTGLPAKIDNGAEVIDPRLTDLDFFIANVDAFGGHSGSAVLDTTGRVAGILVAGRDPDYVPGPGGECNIVNTFMDSEGDEAVQYITPVVTAICESGWTTPLCENEDCVGDDCPPDEWTCSADWYGGGNSCDCNCGVYDPDCDDLALPVDGCLPTETCDEAGACKRILDGSTNSLVGTCAYGGAPTGTGAWGALAWFTLVLAAFVAARRRTH